jgi:hypothetical protein
MSGAHWDSRPHGPAALTRYLVPGCDGVKYLDLPSREALWDSYSTRRAIQHSQESLAKLAARYDLHPKAIAKWKKRAYVHDAPMGPKQPHSTVLTKGEEALIVTFCRHTLLPLDDCLDALQSTIPHLTRSTLHRCLKRHAIRCLPAIEGDKPQKKKFKLYPLGYFRIDIAEVRTEEGKLSLFVAIDRTSKFAYAELHTEATKTVALSSCVISLLLCLTHFTPCSPIMASSLPTGSRINMPSHTSLNESVMNRPSHIG